MTVRYLPRSLFAAVVGLWMLPPAPAEEPPQLNLAPGATLAPRQASPNQKTADLIAETVRQSGLLHNYTLTVTVVDGTATLYGIVADQPQREEAVRLAQGVPGIQRVADRLTVVDGSAIRPVQAGAAARRAAPSTGSHPRRSGGR